MNSPRLTPHTSATVEQARLPALSSTLSLPNAGRFDAAQSLSLPNGLSQWFAEKVRPHETSLRSYLRHSLTSLADVDDLVHECYFRLLRARHSGPIRSTRAFLFTVARNAVRDLLRRRAVADAVPIGENGESCVLEDKCNIVEFISHREELALLEEAICALPERCRQVFLLRKIEDMPQKEISSLLGISEKTVEALVAKGTRRCADYMRTSITGIDSRHAGKPDAFGSGDETVSDAAALWLARRDRGLTPAEAQELVAWQRADLRHAAELARLEAAWRGFTLARASPRLAGMARAVRHAARRRTRRRRVTQYAGLLGAAAAIACVLLWRHDMHPAAKVVEPAATYKVIAESAHRLALPDGSMVEVRDGGKVRAEYTTSERRVRLIRGEAHFKVTRDNARPFIVSAGEVDVRAVGTAFNVRLDASQIEVLVTEGTVAIGDDSLGTNGPKDQGTTELPDKPRSLSPLLSLRRHGGGRSSPSALSPSLSAEGSAKAELPHPLPPLYIEAGQRAVVDRLEPVATAARTVEVTAATTAEIEQALAWQSTRLVFNRTPLEDAIDAFNRYSAENSAPRLVLGDAALRGLRWGGTFRASNVEGFVHLLERSAEVRTERHGDDIVLFRAR